MSWYLYVVAIVGWALLLWGGYRVVKWLISDPIDDNDDRQGGTRL